MFGPPLSFPVVRFCEDYEPVELRGDPWLRDRNLAAGSELARKLTAFAPDLVLVDMFWAPLRWVLPLLDCEAWLLLRLAPPVWYTGTPALPFVPTMYARLLAVEPIDWCGPGSITRIDPVVVANVDDSRERSALRTRFGCSSGERLTIMAHSGGPEELATLRARAGGRAYCLDLNTVEALFPAAEWLGGADRIVCGGGYNAYWEARWIGYAERTEFVPFARSIDDQACRVRNFGEVPMGANGADTLAGWICR